MVRRVTNFGNVNGNDGYLLSEDDFNKIVKIAEGGKVKYFIPAKRLTHQKVEPTKEELREMFIKGMKHSEIAEHFGNSESWLQTRLKKHFGTTSRAIIVKAQQEDQK